MNDRRSAPFAADAETAPPQVRIKIVVLGMPGVGKSTLVRTVADNRSVCTDEVTAKTGTLPGSQGTLEDECTTVAVDFGRRTLPGNQVVYLFGAPGQRRFRHLWKDITWGAFGALVLVDSRRIELSAEVVDATEELGMPYIIAVNAFPDSVLRSRAVVHEQLGLSPATPVITCDARKRSSATEALITLVSRLDAENDLDVS